MKNARQADVVQQCHQHMYMIGHDYPRVQSVTNTSEVHQSFGHEAGDFGPPKPASAESLVKRLFDATAFCRKTFRFRQAAQIFVPTSK